MFNHAVFNNLIEKYELPIQYNQLFEEAFTHSSYFSEKKTPNSNERLEFLGDAVLGMLVATYLYKKFPKYTEGEMTKLRAVYVCEEANSGYAKEMELDKLILLGRGEELSGARNRASALSDVFEAFLGALYLTSGVKTVQKLLSVVVFPHILSRDTKPFIDYKTRLSEILQAEGRTMLTYRLDNVEGPPHERIFTMSAILDGIKLGTGVGKTKKEATQVAAEEALRKMAII